MTSPVWPAGYADTCRCIKIFNVLIKIHYFPEQLLVFLQTVLQDARFNHQDNNTTIRGAGRVPAIRPYYQSCIQPVLFLVLDAVAKLSKATISFIISVRLAVCPSAWNSSAPTGRIFMKLEI
jgi:hypothetical protein